MTEQPQTLLPLAAANANQITKDGVKMDWTIRSNNKSEVLTRLPANIPDDRMFSIMDFMKRAELEAFNIGINFQKDKQNAVLLASIEELKAVNAFLKEENERLVTILNQHLPTED